MPLRAFGSGDGGVDMGVGCGGGSDIHGRIATDGRERERDARGRAERLARGECTGQAVQRARRLTRVREAPTNVCVRRCTAPRGRRLTRQLAVDAHENVGRRRNNKRKNY